MSQINRSFPMLAALTTGLLLLAAAPRAAEAGGTPPEIIGTGEMRSCISTLRIKSTRVLDDRTILFFTKGRDVYRNVLQHRCATLDFHEAFVYRTHSNELCDSDVIEVFTGHEGAGGGACGLSKFERVEIAKPQGRAAMR